KRAISGGVKTKPYVPAKPTTISVDLGTVDSAKEFMGRKGVEFVNPLKIVSRGKDWMEAWDQIWHWYNERHMKSIVLILMICAPSALAQDDLVGVGRASEASATTTPATQATTSPSAAPRRRLKLS